MGGIYVSFCARRNVRLTVGEMDDGLLEDVKVIVVSYFFCVLIASFCAVWVRTPIWKSV